jgi:hypothetical protein
VVCPWNRSMQSLCCASSDCHNGRHDLVKDRTIPCVGLRVEHHSANQAANRPPPSIDRISLIHSTAERFMLRPMNLKHALGYSQAGARSSWRRLPFAELHAALILVLATASCLSALNPGSGGAVRASLCAGIIVAYRPARSSWACFH